MFYFFFFVCCSDYSGNNSQAISGSKSNFTSSGISSSSQIISSSVPNSSSSSSIKEYSNPSQHLTSRVKNERSNSPAYAAHNFNSASSSLHINGKLNSLNHIQAKADPKALVGLATASAIDDDTNVIQSSPISFSMLNSQMTYSDNNSNSNSASNSNCSNSIATITKLSAPINKNNNNNHNNIHNKNSNNNSKHHKQDFEHNSASSSSNQYDTTNFNRSKAIKNSQNLSNSILPDCSSNVITRRESPHQINTQSNSPCAVPNPHFPMYSSHSSSLINSIASPQHQNCAINIDTINNQTFSNHKSSSLSPIDASISRATLNKQTNNNNNNNNSNQVAYSSVIQRAAISTGNCWENENSLQSHPHAHAHQQQNTLNKYQTNIYKPSSASQSNRLPSVSPVQNSHFNGTNANHNKNCDQNSIAAQKIIDSVQQIQSQANTQIALNQQRHRQFIGGNDNNNEQIDQCTMKNDMQKQKLERKSSKIKCNERSHLNAYDKNPSSSFDSILNHQQIDGSTNISDRWMMQTSLQKNPSQSRSKLSPQTNSNFNFNCNNQHNNINNNNNSKNINSTINQSASLMLSHTPYRNSPLSHSYYSNYPLTTLGISDYSNDSSIVVGNVPPYNDSVGTPSVSSITSEREDEPCQKVVVPNIEEELGFLAETRTNNVQQTSTSSQMNQHHSPVQQPSSQNNNLTLLDSGNANNVLTQQTQSHVQHSTHPNQQINVTSQLSQQKTPLTEKKFTTPTGPGSGFMQSYLKFLQGERDSSPPPINNRSGAGNRRTWSKTTAATQNQSNQLQNTQNSSAVASTNSLAGSSSSSGTSHNNNLSASIASINNSKCSMSNGGMQRNVDEQHEQIDSKGNYFHYDRKRSAENDTINNSNNKQQTTATTTKTNRNKNQHQQQNILERAPQVPINAPKKARTNNNSNNLSSIGHQTPNSISTSSLHQNDNVQNNSQQNQPILMQPHPSQANTVAAAHQLVAGSSQILHQQPMYYPQEEGSTFSSYFDYLRRQKW